MNLNDLPVAVNEAVERATGGTPLRLMLPSQGMTSTVAIAESAHGVCIVKRAVGTLYGMWLAQEYRVLTALANQPPTFPIPKPHAFVKDDTGIVSARWLVMDYLPGRPLNQVVQAEHDPARRAEILHAFGATLAAIHATPSPAGIVQAKPSWLDHMLEEAGENLEHFNVDGTPELLARLRSDHPNPVAPTLIHGDYTIDNVLIEGATVTSIIDWSAGAVGDPRHDLALATQYQQEAFSTLREADLQAFYSGYGGQPLSDDEFEYFLGLDEFF
jgi:aminoglycoside phosphotransferase (APT) family kinase protein